MPTAIMGKPNFLHIANNIPPFADVSNFVIIKPVKFDIFLNYLSQNI